MLAQANPKAIACPTGRKSMKGSVGTEKRNQKWAKVSEQCLTFCRLQTELQSHSRLQQPTKSNLCKVGAFSVGVNMI